MEIVEEKENRVEENEMEVDEDSSSSEESSDSEYGSSEEDEGTEDYCRGGYHPVNIGDYFHSQKTRYRVEKKLGWGHFSTVWLARDTNSNQLVALKVQKSAEDYMEAAFDEISLFKDVIKYSDGEEVAVVKFLDAFKHVGPHGIHICMVFELLSDNLYTLVQLYEYQGIPSCLLKRYARQILEGLDHLHRKCSIIHTDIKPENILLTSEYALPKLYEGEPRPPPKPVVNNGQMTKSMKKRLRKKKRICAGTQKSQAPNGGGLTKNQKRRLKMKRLKKMAEEKQREANKAKEELDKNEKTSEEVSSSNSEVEEQRQDEEDEPKRGRRRIRYGEEVLKELAENLKESRVKISDLGNGCWVKKRFTDDITTHEYRSPEVILGAKWGTEVDIWAFACVMFEIATGDLLFKPKKNDENDFDDNDDHLAQMIELMGKIPRKFALSGKKSKSYFNRQGELKNISKSDLKFWGLKDIMIDKYGWTEEDAIPFADFLGRALSLNPVNREPAYKLLEHEWLQEDEEENRLQTSNTEQTTDS